MMPTCPPRGVYAPVVAFFHEDETLDLQALEEHVTRLAKSELAGLVIQGSNGEAPHLLHSERQKVIATASAILKQHGKKDAVIIAGCGAQSTRETIQLCTEAEESGADFALILSPSYWGKLGAVCLFVCLLVFLLTNKTRQPEQCKSQRSRSSSATSQHFLLSPSCCTTFPPSPPASISTPTLSPRSSH